MGSTDVTKCFNTTVRTVHVHCMYIKEWERHRYTVIHERLQGKRVGNPEVAW